MKLCRKILLLILAVSVLNQSIDFDYISYGFGSNQKNADYDDIDSIVELVVENIAGDDDFTHEGDDDSGMPKQKGLEKGSSGFQFFENAKKISLASNQQTVLHQLQGIGQSNKICKGYFEIDSPPPNYLPPVQFSV